jgi:hypothetical protein
MQVSFHVDDPRLNDDLVEAAFAQALETRSKSLTGPGQAVVPDCVSCHKRPIVLGDSRHMTASRSKLLPSSDDKARHEDRCSKSDPLRALDRNAERGPHVGVGAGES